MNYLLKSHGGFLLTFFAVFPFLDGHVAFAKDTSPNWYCKEVASERQGSTILSCGIGTGADENEARSTSFDNAKSEFEKVCAASDDCKYHKITADPKRTTCDRDGKFYKCYRLVVFSIGAKIDNLADNGGKSETGNDVPLENIPTEKTYEQDLFKNAGQCSPTKGKISSPNDYLLSLSDALSEGSAAYKLVTRTAIRKKKKDSSDFLADYIEARQHLNCGILHVFAYEKSSKVEIANSALGIRTAFSKLSALMLDDSQRIKALLNNESDEREGTQADRSAKQQLAYKDAYLLMATAVGVATFSIFDEDSKEKKPQAVVLTTKQRDKIVGKLKKTFGKKVPEKSTNWIEVAAFSLMKFLNDKWNFSKTGG